MRRHEIHEEHINHEAWAIPYGDLITLLLAFFVVMYSISSVNEGKYRTVANSIQNAFNGSPKIIDPIQVGKEPSMSMKPSVLTTPQKPTSEPIAPPLPAPAPETPKAEQAPETPAPQAEAEDKLAGIADRVEQLMAPLIDKQLMVVRRHRMNLEVEIRADVLFPSGVANLSPQALQPLRDLAGILAGFANPLRVEGHTDDVPIATAEYPSNWELSAARAASVARLLIDTGIDPHRLAISGRGEFQPEASNATEEGRNHNRRVKLIVLGAEDDAGDGDPARTIAAAAPAAPAHDAMPAPATPGAHIPGAP
ncbi:MAG TPA: flagellar motor protein MotD [Rhodanobacteraceae bacterium]|nr:flagellar motor protein MotD [Rhodanobacteraceae bacterium]